MAVIILRILLVLLPVLLLVWWLRGRAKRAKGEQIQDKDLKRARLTLLGFVVLIAALGLALKFSDDSGETDLVYVPAKVVDGKLIPGHFVPADEAPAEPAPVQLQRKAAPAETDDPEN